MSANDRMGSVIDCHIHTARSHHGRGDIEDFVRIALAKGIKVLGFSEHAPLAFDHEHRLTLQETRAYLSDIRRIRRSYQGRILILAGLEVDFVPSQASEIRRMLQSLEYDFALGSVHFVETPQGRVNVWNPQQILPHAKEYVAAVAAASESGLFEGVAHPDLILRAGLSKTTLRELFRPVLPVLRAYEVNCSGFTKDRYDPASGIKIPGPSYPDIELAVEAMEQGALLMIGSDAHEPKLVGENIPRAYELLLQHGVRAITYFENRKPRVHQLILSASEGV